MQHYKLGQYIKNKRISLGFTLNKFAFHCEIEPATLSNLERGLSGVTIDTMELIVKGFNKSMGEFYTEYEKYLKDKSL